MAADPNCIDLDEVSAWLEENSFEDFDLEEIVIDVKCEEAAEINNGGRTEQLLYLAEANDGLSHEEFMEWLKQELGYVE